MATPIYGTITTVGPPAWDGSAHSSVGLSGDGFFWVTVATDSLGVAVGLNLYPSSGVGYADITHGFMFTQGSVKVIELGVSKTSSVPFTEGETFYILRKGSVVYYMVGILGGLYYHPDFIAPTPGNVIYVSGAQSFGSVYLDASLYAVGDLITSAGYSYSLYTLTGTGEIVGLSYRGATLTAAGDLVTLPFHGFVDGEVVYFASLSESTGLADGTPYYLVGSTEDTFQVSLTLWGPPVAILSNGTGKVASADSLSFSKSRATSRGALSLEGVAGAGNHGSASGNLTLSGAIGTPPFMSSATGAFPLWTSNAGVGSRGFASGVMGLGGVASGGLSIYDYSYAYGAMPAFTGFAISRATVGVNGVLVLLGAASEGPHSEGFGTIFLDGSASGSRPVRSGLFRPMPSPYSSAVEIGVTYSGGLGGRCIKLGGTGVGVEVLVRDYYSHERSAEALPVAYGAWFADVIPGTYDITYRAPGYAPVNHGPYVVI